MLIKWNIDKKIQWQSGEKYVSASTLDTSAELLNELSNIFLS